MGAPKESPIFQFWWDRRRLYKFYFPMHLCGMRHYELHTCNRMVLYIAEKSDCSMVWGRVLLSFYHNKSGKWAIWHGIAFGSGIVRGCNSIELWWDQVYACFADSKPGNRTHCFKHYGQCPHLWCSIQAAKYVFLSSFASDPYWGSQRIELVYTFLLSRVW